MNDLQAECRQAQETIRGLQEELAETNRGLIALTLQLEDRVAERTAELREAHAELERTNSELMQLTVDLEDRVSQRTAELQKRNTEILRSNQELDDFAYVASHDLKEPLRGIHNYATFLLEDYGEKLDEEGQNKLRTLSRLTQRMETLLDSLLEYSRLGRVDLAMKETDLNRVVEEVLDSLRITLQERAIEVRRPLALPRARCDGIRVAEVFRNLVSNAIKYTDKKESWIEIGVLDIGVYAHAAPGKPAGRQCPVLYVRDNGIGIREKHFDAIFRIFKRLHGRDQYGGGTGAGLTIAKKIVERHGGRIWVESKFGEGTTFLFTLGGGGPPE